MIKSISSSSPYIYIEGGNPLSTYIQGHPGGLNVGSVRFNDSNQNIEVYDVNMWVTMNTLYANVTLSPQGEQLLNWLEKFKQEHEQEILLREKSPAVRNAWEQYQVVKTLATKEKANV